MSHSFVLVYLFFLHFIADFLLQSRKMGKEKSEVFRVLLTHISVQFLVVAIGLSFVFSYNFSILLSLINAAIHGVIDWHIWKGYKLLAWKRIQNSVQEDIKTSPEKFHLDWDKNPNNKEEFIRTKTDEYTSNWKYWEDHWFYVTIGFDQLLHLSTLVLAYGLMSKLFF